MIISPLKKWREKQTPKMSLETLGNKLGVNKTTVMRWENFGVPLKNAFEISEFTKIPTSKLLEHTEGLRRVS